METPNASSETLTSETAESVPDPKMTQVECSAADSVVAAGTGATVSEPKPSYVKLAMRNMVRKRGLSLQHFALTTIGLLGFLVGLSYLTR